MKCFSLLTLFVLFGFLTFCNTQSNPIPGWEYMFAGYDIRNASSKAVDGIKYPIFVPTYNFHQKYDKPGTNIVYDVPDQMYAYPIYETDVTTSTSIYESITEMLTEEITSFSISLGFNIDKFGVSASFQRTWGYIHYLFTQKDIFGAKGFLDTKTTKFVIGPYPLFTTNPYFEMLLSRIPQCPRSAEDLANVALLIEIWGHVFPTSIFMGGRFDVVTSLDESFVNKYDKSWVYTQLSLKFTYEGFDLYAGGFHNRTDIKISKLFEEATHTSLFFIGGDRAYQTNDTEKLWFASVDDYPGLIYGSFSPISALVSDPVKQRNLEYMLTNHVNTGKVLAPPCAYPHSINGKELFYIPGTPFVGAGYDSLTMTTKGFIVQHTYSTKTWTNPFYPQYTYAVADTLYVWDQSSNFEENYTSIAMTNSEFQLQLKSQVSGSSFFGFASHSSSMYVYEYYHEFHESAESTNIRSITWYDLELSPLVQIEYMNHLTPWAQEIFNNLGTDISNPAVKAKYWQALEFYGDSIVTRVSMGGNLFFQGYLDDNTFKSETIEKFQEESGWSFFGLFGGHSSWDYYSKSINQQVKNNMRVVIQVNGGIWTPLESYVQKTPSGAYTFMLKDATQPLLNWDQFVQTIKDNMVPNTYQIQPLYTIFSDPVISNNMKIVTQEYLASKMK